MDPSTNRPNSTTPSAPRATPGFGEERRQSRLRRLAFLLGLVMTAVLVGLLIRAGSPSAVLASWHSSKAEERYEAGDYEGALAAIEKALAALPNEPSLLSMRAEIRCQRQEWTEALADLDLVISLNPNFASGYLKRGHVHQLMQNFDASIADARKARDWWGDDDADGHNALAYSLAVANRQLDEALAEAEKAIGLARQQRQRAMEKRPPAAKEAESDAEGPVSVDDDSLANYIDSRGYVYWRMGQQLQAKDAAQAKAKHQAALADFDEAIRLLNRWKQVILDPAKNLSNRAVIERRLNDTLGVMHQHRHQAHEALGDQEKASADREFAQRLGYDPAKHGL